MPPIRKRDGELHKLSSDSHGASRASLVSDERDRILAAVTEVSSRVGYRSMTVEDIVASAGISRQTFHKHFHDKEEAFLAAYDAAVARTLDLLQAAIAEHETFPAQVRAGLAAYLDFAAREPEICDLCILQVLSAGPKAMEHRNEAMRTAAAILHAVAGEAGAEPTPPLLVAEMVVGGAVEIIYSRLLAGEAAGLPHLHRDLAYSVMLPYLGPEAARRELPRRRSI